MKTCLKRHWYLVLYLRGIDHLFRRDWYATRFNQEGALCGDRIWLIDLGILTIGIVNYPYSE